MGQQETFKKERFVAVLGLHSSGSSCLAGVLHFLGLHLGSQLTGYYGDQPAEGKCGFEAERLTAICEQAVPFLSTEYGMSREVILLQLRGWIDEQRCESARQGTIAAGKYPQLCRLGWQLIDLCGDQLRVIVSERPVEESILSLQRRCPDQPPEAVARHQHWLEEGKRWLLDRVDPSRQLIVNYSQLLATPLHEAERITRFLEITPDEAQMEAVIKWVDPRKRHISLRASA